MLKNPLCNAGDPGSISDQGTKIPHAAGQLNPHTITTESHNKEPLSHKDPGQPKKKKKEKNGQIGEHSLEVPSTLCSPEPRLGASVVGASNPPSPTLQLPSLFLQRKATAQLMKVRNWFCSEVPTGKRE